MNNPVFSILGSLRPKVNLWASRKRESYTFPTSFCRKKVVIVGPNVLIGSELCEKVLQSDILAFVNKGHRSEAFRHLKPLAKKVILFHCLDFSEQTGGGEICSRELRRKGISAIYYPLCEDRFSWNITEFHKLNSALLRLYRIDQLSYSKLKTSVGGFTPNTGYAAIWMIVHGGCSELYVSGINFMRFPYAVDYHAHIQNHSEAIKLIESYGNHNPDLDLESFKQLRLSHNILVDEDLNHILNQPIKPIFYQDNN
jgi:hypothetical protein